VAVLILGLIVFLGIHSVRMVAPDFRDGVIAKRGANTWQIIYSVVSIAGFVMLVYGYGLARENAEQLYLPISGARGVALIVMPIALILLISSQGPVGYIKKTIRHPMLWPVILWASVHLANNGDTASVVMFGALLVWAIFDLVSCYRRGGRPPAASVAVDIVAIIVGLIVTYVFVSFLHQYLFGVGVV